MAFEGLRSKLRSLADSGSDTTREAAAEARRQAPERAREASRAGRRAAGGVAKRAPATGLERGSNPRAPENTRQAVAQRLNESGRMRKPIPDANLEPGADPRFVEAFGRGDATVEGYFDGAETTGDEADAFFGGTESVDFWGVADYQEELADERDHEGGLYAFEDEREEGFLDDGVGADEIMGKGGGQFRW